MDVASKLEALKGHTDKAMQALSKAAKGKSKG